jgi:hypothetical protein
MAMAMVLGGRLHQFFLGVGVSRPRACSDLAQFTAKPQSFPGLPLPLGV